MAPTGPDATSDGGFDALAAAYPEPGAVLILSAHVSDGGVAPAIQGWKVVRVLASGEYREIGEMFSRRSAARACAHRLFPNISGWQKIGATVSAAVVRSTIATAEVSKPALPRRRPNGIRIPLWRP